MALGNIFEQHGIKEVADVQFEALETDAKLGVNKGDIVLYLDTLKISTLETTAEQTEAKGGKGNPPLIIWDFGKEITVTLQDALFTMASIAVMNGVAVSSSAVTVRRTEEVTLAATQTLKLAPTGSVRFINLTKGTRGFAGSTSIIASTAVSGASIGDRVKLFYDTAATAGASYSITISAETFPGAYKVIGDTYIRNQNNVDSGYQFVINRAKVDSSSTLTMEAEGDPAVFDMNLRVLRDDDKNMIKFIKYDL